MAEQIGLFDLLTEEPSADVQQPVVASAVSSAQQSLKEVAARMDFLVGEVNRHNDLYHQQDAPEITDAEFDVMKNELLALERDYPMLTREDSPTQTVGGKLSSELEKVVRQVPMLSLGNIYTEDDLRDFDRQVHETLRLPLGTPIDYTVELKMDGIAGELVYNAGNFVLGSTRGDGVTGEDITHNLRTIKDIPASLTGPLAGKSVTLRGESYMLIDVFRTLNEELTENGQDPLANPRNAAGGTLRKKDSVEAAKRPLSFYAYGHAGEGDEVSSTHSGFLQLLIDSGIKVNDRTRTVNSIEEIVEFYNNILAERDDLPYEIDGVVIKVDSYDLQHRLGERSNTPRWATAWKFPPRQAITKLRSCTLQVGRTGVITPVAELEPVYCSGVTVSRATLHNWDIVTTKDIRVGDTVVVERAADVIPAVVKAITDKRDGTEQLIPVPTECPVCGAPVIKREKEVAYRCSNVTGCPAIVKTTILHFVSRGGMNIDGMGEQVVNLLLAEGLISNYADIYSLTLEQIAGLPRMGKKSADNIMKAIEGSKKRELRHFIAALGIRQVSEGGSKRLAKHFGSIEKVMSASYEDLLKVDDVGPDTAGYIVAFFSDPHRRELVERLLAAGVAPVGVAKVSDRFAGKTFVFTGTLTRLKRADAEAQVELNGGKASKSVSKKTHYLVAGPGAGDKLNDAHDINREHNNAIQIISEDDFIAMLND